MRNVLDALNKALENKSLDSRAKDAIRKSITDVKKPRDLKKKPKPKEEDKKRATR